MSKRKIRRSIRIDGKLVSKAFTSREAAEKWYNFQFNKKGLESAGAVVHLDDVILFKDFALGEFMERRRAEYPKSTWASDEQRLHDYLIPAFGNMPMNKISAAQVRVLLSKLVTKMNRSPKTRDRVRALISAIFNDAINRDDGALVSNNPTFGLSFKKGKRRGSKPPSFLHTNNEGVRYFKAAATLSMNHMVIGGLGLNGGLRKQEMIALRWGCVDLDEHSLAVTEKYIQASNSIVPGTKAGEESERHVPMSDELETILLAHKANAKFKEPSDFILAGPDGSHMSPKQIYRMHMETCALAGVKVTVHGLRHTFGREFAERSGGNVGALKDILGHSNLMVTQQYASLGKGRLKSFRSTVSYSGLHRQRRTNDDTD